MHSIAKSTDPQKNYRRMVSAIRGALVDETDFIAGLANVSAFIAAYMDRLNWAGFYLAHGGALVLGPFQGLPACARIELGKGVCGATALEKRNVRVDDVHEFPGHIACDSASRSELVLPFYRNGKLAGVIDLDSPEKARFTALEEQYMDQVARLLDEFVQRVTG